MIDPIQFWQAMPDDVKSLTISMAANLATRFIPEDQRKTGMHKKLAPAFEEGFRRFGAHFGENCYYALKDFLVDEEALGHFAGMLADESLVNETEPLQNAVDRAGIDIAAMEGFNLKNAAADFVSGYRSVAEWTPEGMQQLSYFSSLQQTEIQKEIRDILTALVPPQSDLAVLREKYFTYLIEKFATLSFKGLSERMLSIPIKSLYTPLTFSRELAGSRREYLQQKEQLSPALMERGSSEEKTVAFADILDSPYTIVTGEPGAGKSTLLKYIAVAFAQGKAKGRLQTDESLLPILFPVSAFAEALLRSTDPKYGVNEFLSNHFQSKGLPDLLPLFTDAAKSGRAFYLIDGLDEVSDEAKRQKMVSWLRDFMINNTAENSRYLVTCRTASYTRATRFDAVRGKEFTHLTVKPFNLEKIEKFLLNWYGWYQKKVRQRKETFEAEARNDLSKMMAVIRNDENIFAIATNPLMLTILALIEHEGGQLPRNRADLYQKCLNMLAGAWENIRSLHETENREFKLGDRRITEDFIVEFLGPVARKMHTKATPEIEYGKLKQTFTESFETRNKDLLLSREQADDFIKILKQQSGILHEASTGIYAFSHLTFKEYLTARVITDLTPDPIHELKGRLFKPEWQEVVLLIAATLKKLRATEFIRAILESKTSGYKNYLLAGQCVVDIGRDRISDNLFDELIAGIKTVAFGDTPAIQRAQITEILGRLGDDRDLKVFGAVSGGDYRLSREKFRLSAFEIGQYLVTNSWFSGFIDGGGYDKLKFWSVEGQKWLGHTGIKWPWYWNDRKWNCANAPVVGVCWYEADAFCRWLTQTLDDGCVYRLPDENEWEAAAAGKTGRKYPWGPEWQEDVCNTEESKIGKTSPVGIFNGGKTPEGIHDMAGNLWEWTRSEYHNDKTLEDFAFDPEIQKLWDRAVEGDKKALDEYVKQYGEKSREIPVLRGGSWSSEATGAQCAYRSGDIPNARLNFIGFRCVRTLK